MNKGNLQYAGGFHVGPQPPATAGGTDGAFLFPQLVLIAAIVFLFPLALFAQTQIATQPSENILEVNDASDMEVIAIAKTVIVKGTAKGVFVTGGDVIIEGTVAGDVGVIGGNVIQKEGASIGGDVIVFGGSYKPESKNPLRADGKETIVLGVFEEELRDLGQNPTQIFAPTFSGAFVAQRILSVLFWFVVTLIFSTIAPGAVSRAIARFQLSTLKVVGLGLAGLILSTVGVVAGFGLLPDYLSGVLWLMIFVLLMLAYLFGRVALHLSVGKQIQKYFFPDRKQSETVAILVGVLVWTVLLSVPYLWTLALLALFATGVGLVLTARSNGGWRSA